MILGILGLKFGSDLVVDHSIIIAQGIGLSERFIGMTIIAVGTALPEIITGIIAAKKGKTDLLLGNISGSNILNLCLLIGLGAIINPLVFVTDFNQNLFVLIGITILIQFIAVVNKKKQLGSLKGLFLIVVYFLYLWSML